MAARDPARLRRAPAPQIPDRTQAQTTGERAMLRRLILVWMQSLAAALPARAALRAWVDNPQVAPGETVRLTLAHDGQTTSRPDLGPLKQDFDIVGSSTSSQVQIVNGNVSSTTQLELSLSPKHGGPLT